MAGHPGSRARPAILSSSSDVSACGIHFRLGKFRGYLQQAILKRGMDAGGVNRVGKIDALKYSFAADGR